MIQFILSTQNRLKAWRNKYFNSLNYAQDMYSESIISWMPGAMYYIIDINNVQSGYLILNNNELIEFYIQDNQLTHKESIFSEALIQLKIKSAYCKSFDQVFLSCCHKFSGSSKLTGYLFQDYSFKLNANIDNEIDVRLADLNDIPFLNSFENELLGDGETIDAYVQNNSVYMFMKSEDLIGCGYLFNIIPGRKHYDVGMWVNKNYRKKSYGTMIISYLMNYCFENGFIPTAGCEESNVASRRTLEKCGFVSKLCLIYFRL